MNSSYFHFIKMVTVFYFYDIMHQIYSLFLHTSFLPLKIKDFFLSFMLLYNPKYTPLKNLKQKLRLHK